MPSYFYKYTYTDKKGKNVKNSGILSSVQSGIKAWEKVKERWEVKALMNDWKDFYLEEIWKIDD